MNILMGILLGGISFGAGVHILNKAARNKFLDSGWVFAACMFAMAVLFIFVGFTAP